MRNLTYILFLFTIVIQSQTKMTDDEAKRLKQKVELQAEKTKDLSADFIQEKQMEFLDKPIKGKGILHYKKPALVKWSYTEPYQYTVLFKDKAIYTESDGAENRIALNGNKLFEQLSKLIVNSVNGNLFDDDLFTINFFEEKGIPMVKFYPKDSDLAAYIKELVLYFSADGDVERVKTVEPSGDYTTLRFINKKRNTSISDEVFSN